MLISLVLAVLLVAVAVSLALQRRWRGRTRVRLERLATLVAPLWSLGVTGYALLLFRQGPPVPEAFGGSPPSAPAGDRTFLEVNGMPGVLFLLVAVILTALPWATTDDARRRHVMLVAGALLLVVATAGALSVGLWYVPSGLAQIVAAIVFRDAPADDTSAHM